VGRDPSEQPGAKVAGDLAGARRGLATFRRKKNPAFRRRAASLRKSRRHDFVYNHDLDGDQVELLIDKFATNLEGIAYTRGRSTNDKHSVGAVNRGAFGIPAGRPRRPARRARPL